MCNILNVKYTLFMLLLAGMVMFKGNIFADTFKESYCIFGSFKFKYNLNSGNVGMFVFCEEKRKLKDFLNHMSQYFIHNRTKRT